MLRKLPVTILCGILLFTMTPAFSKADDAGNKELQKITETIFKLTSLETVVEVLLSGEGLKDKPNVPREGRISVAKKAVQDFDLS